MSQYRCAKLGCPVLGQASPRHSTLAVPPWAIECRITALSEKQNVKIALALVYVLDPVSFCTLICSQFRKFTSNSSFLVSMYILILSGVYDALQHNCHVSE
ncbi:Protein of unknown function [Cotesia congregata]|uniref:Uncharacterized protein n=1 Tax=Cotesia congregata TaxID=51543 RepID=A0A8J2HTE2_COTCN|nr:Protein of unknown function [Cotesia congregata]